MKKKAEKIRIEIRLKFVSVAGWSSSGKSKVSVSLKSIFVEWKRPQSTAVTCPERQPIRTVGWRSPGSRQPMGVSWAVKKEKEKKLMEAAKNWGPFECGVTWSVREPINGWRLPGCGQSDPRQSDRRSADNWPANHSPWAALIATSELMNSDVLIGVTSRLTSTKEEQTAPSPPLKKVASASSGWRMVAQLTATHTAPLGFVIVHLKWSTCR